MSNELEPDDEAEVSWSQTRVSYPLKQYLDVLHGVVETKKGRSHVEAGFPGVTHGHVHDVLRIQTRELKLPVEVGKSPTFGVCVRYREPQKLSSSASTAPTKDDNQA